MAEEAKKKNNKNLIIGICAGILVVAVIVVAIIFATKGTTPALSDAFFVSTDTKYVITEEGDGTTFEGTEYVPVKTHLVYEYSGDKITGVTNYVEFADENTARLALEDMKKETEGYDLSEVGIKSISTNGKYVVIVATEDLYSDYTISDVKFETEMDNSDLEDVEDYVEEDIEIEEDEE